MNAVTTVSNVNAGGAGKANVDAVIRSSPQFTCKYDEALATVFTTWFPRGIPSFNVDLLNDLEASSQALEERFRPGSSLQLRHVVLQSTVPGVFNLGGDLGYLHRLITTSDRARIAAYASAAVNAVYRNYTAHGLGNVGTIALLQGDALGGGLECALSCDVVVAEKHVKAGFPEVLFDMFPGMGGISFLYRRVSRRTAEELIRSGRLFSAQELYDLGVIDAVVETADGERYVRQFIKQRDNQAAAHAAMNVVDRLIRPLTLNELHDVGRIWVDRALSLSPRGLEWMNRLHQRQLSVFGRSFSVAASTNAVTTEQQLPRAA
jgi:DSF synthase